MVDNILRILTIIGLAVMFVLVVNYTNLIMFNTYDDRLNSSIIIGIIGTLVGLSMCVGHNYQGLSDLIGKGFLTGSAFLLIMSGGDALYVSNKETQIMVMGIILVTLLYVSTFVL